MVPARDPYFIELLDIVESTSSDTSADIEVPVNLLVSGAVLVGGLISEARYASLLEAHPVPQIAAINRAILSKMIEPRADRYVHVVVSPYVTMRVRLSAIDAWSISAAPRKDA